MTPQEPERPPLSPQLFAKTLLNQVVGNTDNPNKLSSERVLQLVRQGVQKPSFMQEYLKSGGVGPRYSVLSDSEYMAAYNTDQIPDRRPVMPPDPGMTPTGMPPDDDRGTDPGMTPPGRQPYPDAGWVPPGVPPDPGMTPPVMQPRGMTPPVMTPPVMGRVPSESLLQGDFGTLPPMYSSPPTQQGYSYDPNAMARLLRQLLSR